MKANKPAEETVPINFHGRTVNVPANQAYHYIQKPERDPRPDLVYRRDANGDIYGEYIIPRPGMRIEDPTRLPGGSGSAKTPEQKAQEDAVRNFKFTIENYDAAKRGVNQYTGNPIRDELAAQHLKSAYTIADYFINTLKGSPDAIGLNRLTPEMMDKYLEMAGNDPQKAKMLAFENRYIFY